MVKVTYKPYQELIIHELVRYKLHDLATLRGMGAPSGGIGKALYWAAGLALVTNPLPTTEAVVRDQLDGIAHWGYVAFAPMPKFQPFMVIKDSNVKIPVIDTSTNPIFNAAATWIKQYSGLKVKATSNHPVRVSQT